MDTEVCSHGNLARSCEMCFLSTERVQYLRERDKARGELAEARASSDHSECERALEAMAGRVQEAEQERDRLREALEAWKHWWDTENAGPVYPEGVDRDCPHGERIWKAWYHQNLANCERAGKLQDIALAGGEGV